MHWILAVISSWGSTLTYLYICNSYMNSEDVWYPLCCLQHVRVSKNWGFLKSVFSTWQPTVSTSDLSSDAFTGFSLDFKTDSGSCCLYSAIFFIATYANEGIFHCLVWDMLEMWKGFVAHYTSLKNGALYVKRKCLPYGEDNFLQGWSHTGMNSGNFKSPHRPHCLLLQLQGTVLWPPSSLM